jgi:hypothetical protein
MYDRLSDVAFHVTETPALRWRHGGRERCFCPCGLTLCWAAEHAGVTISGLKTYFFREDSSLTRTLREQRLMGHCLNA